MNHLQLPADLIDRVEVTMRHLNRMLLSGKEATSEIMREIDEQVDWEIDSFDEQIETHRINSLILDVAKTMAVPHGILSYACSISPPGTDPELDQIIIAAMQDITSIESASRTDSFYLLQDWIKAGGELPARFNSEIKRGEPLSLQSWFRYLIARNSVDSATQQQLATADLAGGCPALLLFHLRESRASQSEVEAALNQIDPVALRADERWGDLTSIIVFLAERGWMQWAMEWGALIDDAEIHPWMTFLNQSHHPVLQRCWEASDARVFASFALIDYLGGDLERAQRKIHRSLDLDPDGERFRNEFAGHRSMLDWIQSRLISDPNDRRKALESIQPGKASLGLLQAQIDADIADLAESSGDFETSVLMRKRSANTMQYPKVDLHMAHFPYDDLLWQLPVNASQRNRDSSET